MTKAARFTREIIAHSGSGYTTHERMNANGDIRYWIGRRGHEEIYDYVIQFNGDGTEIYKIVDRENLGAKLVAFANGEFVYRAQTLCVDALEGYLREDMIFEYYGEWAGAAS